MTAGRPGDIFQLRPADVTISQSKVCITFRSGKGVLQRGAPYVVFSTAGQTTNIVKSYVSTRAEKMFDSSKTWLYKRATLILKSINKALCLRSIRRGSVEQVAKNPQTTLEVLMKFTGHKRQTTCLRYLRWGLASAHLRATMDLPLFPFVFVVKNGKRLAWLDARFARTLTAFAVSPLLPLALFYNKKQKGRVCRGETARVALDAHRSRGRCLQAVAVLCRCAVKAGCLSRSKPFSVAQLHKNASCACTKAFPDARRMQSTLCSFGVEACHFPTLTAELCSRPCTLLHLARKVLGF